jgi:hypothetical protein
LSSASDALANATHPVRGPARRGAEADEGEEHRGHQRDRGGKEGLHGTADEAVGGSHPRYRGQRQGEARFDPAPTESAVPLGHDGRRSEHDHAEERHERAAGGRHVRGELGGHRRQRGPQSGRSDGADAREGRRPGVGRHGPANVLEHALNLRLVGEAGLVTLCQLAERIPVQHLVHGNVDEAVAAPR